MRFVILILFINIIGYNVFAQSFTSSNLPILKINTYGQAILDDPKINANLKIVYNGPGERNQVNSTSYHFDGKIGIEIRGQSSLIYPKKGYGFEFRDAEDEDLDTAVLDFPEESDFVLHGPYSDKSLIRNALAYILAGKIMNYAPRVCMTELMINGSYKGLYLFTEKIKQNKNRVNISKLKSDDLSGDELTGGYIIKIDKISEGDEYWHSAFPPFPGANNRPVFVHHYPKGSKIQSEQMEYIQGEITNFETLMYSNQYENPTYGFPSLLDVQTFVDFFIINEIARNVDAYRLSTYLYKDKDSVDGRIKVGPVWDFNFAFGNADYCNGWLTSGWAYDFSDVCPWDEFKMPFWWPKMLSSSTFKTQSKTRWDMLRQGALSDESISTVYDSLVDLTAEAQERNFVKWPVLGVYVWANSHVSSSHAEEISWLRNWLENRLNWLDNQFDTYPIGIQQQSLFTEFNLYPNPFQDEFILDFVPSINGKAEIQLFDQKGRLVYNKPILLMAGQHFRQNYHPNLPKGHYSVIIRQEDILIHNGSIQRM